MEIYLLFRKHSPLKDDGLPWLEGAEKHTCPARRNPTGNGVVSAILVRALLACLEGALLSAKALGGEIHACVASHSTPGLAVPCMLAGHTFHIPHGGQGWVTYHLGVLAILRALLHPALAPDFWEAYQALLEAYHRHGKDMAIKEPLCQASDELYYLIRYGNAEPSRESDLAGQIEITSNHGLAPPLFGEDLDLAPLTDSRALRRLLSQDPGGAQPLPAAPEEAPERPEAAWFTGWQAQALVEALAAGENILLAGPTGSGKTACFQQVAANLAITVEVIEGKEGLVDLDFLGAILPQKAGERRWVDGPLLRAMRTAGHAPVVLFLDEINRIPRRQVNLLLALMNPKSGAFCRQMGLPVTGRGPFYTVEVPMTSELVLCPTEHLRIVAAGNFGKAYSVYDLDPALRRRFDTVLEFDYPDPAQEMDILQARTGLNGQVGQALVNLAQETRRLMANGELPGCIDTGLLLNWAGKCFRQEADTASAVMGLAELTWADTVCGRDHQGRVNPGNFRALYDYLESLALMPAGTPLRMESLAFEGGHNEDRP